MAEKTAQALWQNYLFLTKEMIKFLDEQDMDLVYELMKQRELLQSLIVQTPDDGFKASPVGESLHAEIQLDNQYILDHLQFQFNKSKRSREVAEVYTGANIEQSSRMIWKG